MPYLWRHSILPAIAGSVANSKGYTSNFATVLKRLRKVTSQQTISMTVDPIIISLASDNEEEDFVLDSTDVWNQIKETNLVIYISYLCPYPFVLVKSLRSYMLELM